MLTREQAETISLLHAKVARAFAGMMRVREGSGAFKEAMQRWLAADLGFLASIGDLTAPDATPPAKAEDGMREVDDAMVERAAWAFEKALGRDPDAMTYITDDGIQQPYGPAYMHNIEPMRDALRAALAKEGT